jgi:uncharacterized iron-regulated membrane protein
VRHEVSFAAIQEPTTGSVPISADQAVTIARTQIPDGLPYRVQMPKYGGLYQVAFQAPNDGTADGNNVVTLDPYGRLVSSTRSSDLSTGDKVLEINQAVHTGAIFGIPGRVAVALASAAVILQVVSGLLLWRRGTKSPLADRPMREQVAT